MNFYPLVGRILVRGSLTAKGEQKGTEDPTTIMPYKRTDLDALNNWSVVTPNITSSGTQRSYVVIGITTTKS